MITCSECGKVNGTGAVGTYWICGDCRVGGAEQDEQQETETNMPAPDGQPNAKGD